MTIEEKTMKPYNSWPNDKGFDGDHDVITPTELAVSGAIPAYAAGTLYRTGPGGYQIDTDKGTTFSLDHWFDGLTQVHRFQIVAPSGPEGPVKVLYNSKHTVDESVERVRKSGDLKGFSFGQKHDPCESYFKKVMAAFIPTVLPAPETKDTANIGVTLSPNMPGGLSSMPDKQTHASGVDSLWLKTDASTFKEIDPETLEPIGLAKQAQLHKDLTGPMSAAHAKSDPITGDVFNFNMAFGRRPTYRVFRVSASTGKTEILATITDAEPAYLHSLFLTENYVVLCVWNSHVAAGGIKVLWEQNILDALAPFDATKEAKWYVVDRRSGKGVVARYESDPFFSFHTINAWEEPSTEKQGETDIVADTPIYENNDVLKRFYYDNMKGSSPASRDFLGPNGDTTRPHLTRYRLRDITQGAGQSGSRKARPAETDWTAPQGSSMELPTINPKFLTKPSRYIYGVADTGASTFFDSLVKYDAQTHTCTRWSAHAQTPGEAIFIPDPAGVQEDDGVLLSVVLDGTKGKSYLLCLDPGTMEEVGRAGMESVVGFGFHGAHVPARSRKARGDAVVAC